MAAADSESDGIKVVVDVRLSDSNAMEVTIVKRLLRVEDGKLVSGPREESFVSFPDLLQLFQR